ARPPAVSASDRARGCAGTRDVRLPLLCPVQVVPLRVQEFNHPLHASVPLVLLAVCPLTLRDTPGALALLHEPDLLVDDLQTSRDQFPDLLSQRLRLSTHHQTPSTVRFPSR